jgi:hypothetical protein
MDQSDNATQQILGGLESCRHCRRPLNTCRLPRVAQRASVSGLKILAAEGTKQR